MTKLAVSLNESEKNSLAQRALIRVQERFHKKYRAGIRAKGRSLLAEGEIAENPSDMQSSSSPRKWNRRTLYLFNDLLLCASGHSKLKVAWKCHLRHCRVKFPG